MKHLLEDSQDIHLALLTYRATPMPWCGLSPAELLIGRRVHTDVPQIEHLFIPKWPYLKNFRRLDQKLKAEQKRYYDCCHRVRPLPPYLDELSVWVNTGGTQVPGQIVQPANTPRSYLVNTPSGQVLRNQRDLRVRSEELTDTELETRPRSITTRSCLGITVHLPDRLTY